MVHVGIGYDVHALVAGRKLILGGVEIPHPRGLDGHSDADALMHAICDALLGALGEPDIGHFFPNTDPRWKGAPSKVFLAEAARQVAKRKGKIVNMDATVIAQQPIEVIPADFKPVAAGVGERRPWVARVTDPMVLIRAVAEGKVPLMHTIPVRTKVNGKFQDVMTAVPVVEINMSVLHYAAKRLGMENIGFPGAVGERDFGLSFRKTDDPGPQEEY